MAKRPVTTADILNGHVSLDLECLDRIYLNGYVPNLQVGGQVVQFLALRGFPIPSPVVVGRIGDQFRRSAGTVRPVRGSRGGVGAGVSAGSHVHHHTVRHGGAPHFGWDRADRRVTCYYFYVVDDDFGSAFVKIGCYFPYPIKVWLNGHEWAKRQATVAGIGWTALANGFASRDDSPGL